MNNKRTASAYSSGQIVLINTFFFLAISVIIVFGVASPVISSAVSTKAFLASKQSFLLANSAGEEALYRLKNSMNLSSSQTIELASGEAEIQVSDTFDGKTITIESDVASFERNIQFNIAEAEGVSFNYGLQAGKGGFELSGGSLINGNVYSNGDIIGSGSPAITGSAIVANASTPSANQSSSGPMPPTNTIDFSGRLVWNDVKPGDIAQSFQVSTTTPISSIRLYLKKYANVWMNNVTVRIKNNAGGNPGNSTLASGNLSATQVTTGFNYLTIPFTSPVSLTPGTTYWIVLDGDENGWNSYYTVAAASNSYALGQAKIYSSGWTSTSPSGLDFYFDLYTGGDMGLISGMRVGTSGSGDAWAYEVKNTTVTGALYCQASTSNNKPCDTSRPDPAEQPFPISEGNIAEWKERALDGGTTVGNINIGSDDVIDLGPQKIEGDLTVGSGAILNVTGNLWVTGNVSVSGGGIIRLSTTYGSGTGIVVADGRVSAGGGGQFQGSGATGSYILLITTSACPNSGSCSGNPAVSVSGGTGAVILNAQNGTIEFSGGAQAKQATANKIIMSGGTTINYESGLADVNFTGGPSGSWNMSDWKEF